MNATAANASKAGEKLLDLDSNTFHPFLEEAGDTLVVVDFYTDWCVAHWI